MRSFYFQAISFRVAGVLGLLMAFLSFGGCKDLQTPYGVTEWAYDALLRDDLFAFRSALSPKALAELGRPEVMDQLNEAFFGKNITSMKILSRRQESDPLLDVFVQDVYQIEVIAVGLIDQVRLLVHLQCRSFEDEGLPGAIRRRHTKAFCGIDGFETEVTPLENPASF